MFPPAASLRSLPCLSTLLGVHRFLHYCHSVCHLCWSAPFAPVLSFSLSTLLECTVCSSVILSVNFVGVYRLLRCQSINLVGVHRLLQCHSVCQLCLVHRLLHYCHSVCQLCWSGLSVPMLSFIVNFIGVHRLLQCCHLFCQLCWSASSAPLLSFNL